VTSALSWPKSWYVLEPSKSTASADAFTGLASGDILLSCPSEPTAVQHAVQKLQARWYANQHAAFTHVGVYVGEDWVVDAVPQFGVSRRSLGSFGIACSIRARRSRGISADQQHAIVDLATRWAALGQPYSFLRVFAAALAEEARPSPKSRWAKTIKKIAESESDASSARSGLNGVYCGELVNRIVGSCTNRSIINDSSCFAALPAAFSADQAEFENVRLLR
jgi:hypothetical protein